MFKAAGALKGICFHTCILQRKRQRLFQAYSGTPEPCGRETQRKADGYHCPVDGRLPADPQRAGLILHPSTSLGSPPTLAAFQHSANPSPAPFLCCPVPPTHSPGPTSSSLNKHSLSLDCLRPGSRRGVRSVHQVRLRIGGSSWSVLGPQAARQQTERQADAF